MSERSERLSESLKAAAEANGRTISEEIDHRLEQSFDHPALIDALANRLEERLAEFERNNCAFEFIHVESGPVQ